MASAAPPPLPHCCSLLAATCGARSLALPPGPAYFKYLVDGEWICSPCEQVVQNGKGFNNHRCAGCCTWAGCSAVGVAPTAELEVQGRQACAAQQQVRWHLFLPACNSWKRLLTCTPRASSPAGRPRRSLIQPTATFTWRSSELGGHDVLLTGSFNSWAELLPLTHDVAAGTHSLRCCLPQVGGRVGAARRAVAAPASISGPIDASGAQCFAGPPLACA